MKEGLPEMPDDLPGQITELRTALIGLINNSLESNAKMNKLSEQLNDLQILQKQTDERLNAVILMAERFFSGENEDSKKRK